MLPAVSDAGPDPNKPAGTHTSPEMHETPYSRFAQERSHNDAKGYVEFGKTLIQMLVGINGLAATGLITLQQL